MGEQRGINMVDLMMWLVIAVLLLAAALQGIGYYQKAAVIHQMQNDLSGAGSNVMAVAANTKGAVDKVTADEGVANTKFSKDVSPFVEVMSGSTTPYLRATHPGVTDLDVIYMFKDCLPLKVGLNIVPKTGGGVLEACGIAASPDPTTPPSTGTPTTPPATTAPTTPPATTPPATTPPTTPPPVVVPASMITEWDTTIVPNNVISQDAVACQTIRLPMNGTVNATVDWGDGTKDTVTSPYPQHTYSTSGTKTVSISGTFTGWVGENMSGLWSNECITKVTKWDDASGTVDGSRAFNGANNLTQVANIPSGITNYFLMFAQATKFNGDLSNLDTSKVTNMSLAFYNATAFNSDITKWNVSNVTNTNGMFEQATSFNQPIGSWNVGNVTDMASMFYYATKFDQPLGSWNVSKVTAMDGLFGNTPFNQDISNWNTSNVTGMSSLFDNASRFTGDISRWDTSKVQYMDSMFRNNSVFTGDISRWNTSSLLSTAYMFQFNTAFNGDITKWDTSKVTNMRQMFDRSTVFNQNLSGWNISSVTDAYYFIYGSALEWGNLPPFPAGMMYP